LKLFGNARHSHAMSHVFDPGLALFAGLNVFPKRSLLTESKSKHITIGTGSNFTGECLVRKTNNQPEAYCLCPRLRYLRLPLTSKNGCCASCAPGAMATCWPYIFSCFVRVTRRQARLPTS